MTSVDCDCCAVTGVRRRTGDVADVRNSVSGMCMRTLYLRMRRCARARVCASIKRDDVTLYASVSRASWSGRETQGSWCTKLHFFYSKMISTIFILHQFLHLPTNQVIRYKPSNSLFFPVRFSARCARPAAMRCFPFFSPFFSTQPPP